jgi:heavy metal translocating P-type ATPase
MVASLTPCALCGLPAAHPLSDADGRQFCCPACREVAALLADAPAAGAAEQQPADQPAALSTVTLALSGLWCASCGWLVERTLRRAPGVHGVEVSVVQREARVQFDPGRTAPRRLARRVGRLGYRATLPGERPHDEEGALFTRLAICTVFVIHDVVMSAMLYGREWLGMNTPDDAWIIRIFVAMMLLGGVPILLVLGLPILRAGLAGLLRGRPDMHTLIALGAFSAFGLSLFNMSAGVGRVYFDTTSMLLFLVAVGRWVELRAQKAGSKTVDRLWAQLPQRAAWITPEGEREVAPDALPRGARVRVRPGERFPVDGLVAAGEGDVDESLLTGEPEPVLRRPGEPVLAGTLSMDGGFEVITTAVGADTAAGQIGRLLHQALWQRAPVERLADRLAAWMTPAAALLAAATFAYWVRAAGPEVGLMHALAVLLIACPCALGIATPLALWAALGRAAEGGVILRGTGALERLAAVRQLFFDKTGTLTRLPATVQELAADGVAPAALLARVAAVEALSEHPLARALVAAAGERGLAPPAASGFRALPGRGVVAALDGQEVWVGSERLMRAEGLALPPALEARAADWRRRGLGVLYAGWDGRVAGLVGLGETPRPEARAAVAELRELGLEVAVLTGDDAAAGERWRRQLGVPVYAEQRPEDKLQRLRDAAGPVAMVGDGINDGPALAAAVGLTLAGGTEVARAAADMILLRDDLRAIPWLVRLSRAAMGCVRQNLAWAFVYNLAGLALAVTGHLQPVAAAAAMVLSSLLVTANALRLRRLPIAGEPAEAEAPPAPQLAPAPARG